MKQIDKLIITSPYREPTQHWKWIEETEEFKIINARREAGYLINDPRKGTRGSKEVKFAEVNKIRKAMARWEADGMPNITGVTKALLTFWHEKEVRRFPFFFCQLEAIKSIIFLNEAPPAYITGIDIEGDGGPFIRWCNKMATGSGKTILATMLVAYNIINKVTYKQDTRFSKNILVVAPGLTVKSRLQVINPTSENNYFDEFGVVPPTMMDKLRQGRLKIINWHMLAWNTQEKIDKKVASGQLRSVDKRQRIEMSDTAYAKMVLGDMANAKNILVINDEAHHAWRTTPESKVGKKKADEIDNTIWIGGLDKLHSKIGILRCHDLSATPFVPTGKKSNDEGLFSWIISDFGLNDAIETGLVKTPRIVVREDGRVNTKELTPRLFHLYEEPDVKTDLNQKSIPPETPLPDLVKNAYELLALDWLETKRDWQKEGKKIPPVMMTVANLSITAERIKSHFDQGDCSVKEICVKEKTLHIDAKTLGKAENEDTGLTGSKKEIAEQLRLTVDTVGKKGKPGEQIQNVISVAMLSEGWDANNVTQIMGLRAFTSQLLCEQVVGRGLRRVSYDFDDDGMLPPEYVNIFGVPFTLIPHEGGGGAAPTTKPKFAIEPTVDKLDQRIIFPNVLRIDTVYKSSLTLDHSNVKPIEIDPADAIEEVELAGVVSGKPSAAAMTDIDLKELDETYRLQTLIFKVASKVFAMEKNAWPGNQHAFLGQLFKITEDFIHSDRIVIKSDLFNNDPLRRKILLMLNMTRIIQHFWSALKTQNAEKYEPIIDKERPQLSTSDMPTWYTSKSHKAHKKSHINHTVFDSSWEANNADILEHSPLVKSFVKNDHLGFKVSYKFKGIVKNYLPDYIVALENGDFLILEVKGQNTDEVRAKFEFLELWVKGVNDMGGFGKWHWAPVFNSSEIYDVLNKYPVFPKEAFLPQKDPLPTESKAIIATHVGEYYEIELDVIKQQKNVKGMIDVVIKGLVEKNMNSIYETIQTAMSQRGEEEILEQDELKRVIYSSLDGMAPQSIEKYKMRVRNWYSFTKKLDKLSFDYLTSAEYMYDTMTQFRSDDYSPFIVQYARVVEHELKTRLFIPFTLYQQAQPGRLIDAFGEDLDHRTTSIFAKMVIYGNTHFTLGNMTAILSMANRTDLIQRSPLMEEFYMFLIEEYDKNVTRPAFVDKLKDLKDKYRNVAAHTGKMSSEQARDCKMLVGELLNQVIGFGEKKNKAEGDTL